MKCDPLQPARGITAVVRGRTSFTGALG